MVLANQVSNLCKFCGERVMLNGDYSMNKARKFGWHGYVDSIESMRAVFEKFAEMKMIPPF